MKKHRVWELVYPTPGMNVIPVKWGLCVKDNSKRRARLVAKGCVERNENYDTVYAPVASMKTFECS